MESEEEAAASRQKAEEGTEEKMNAAAAAAKKKLLEEDASALKKNEEEARKEKESPVWKEIFVGDKSSMHRSTATIYGQRAIQHIGQSDLASMLKCVHCAF
mmetsp:Transcript_49864/g.73250  ORF Transcript_49864/g.73250 Transcript_49864/m.73250 type:complete len:101 (-) Transcript_49864:291-593(-)